MAIKAGLVGVNPKGVDHNGMPIASDSNGVKEAQLTANGKKFFFAYDETSEKYGYKLDGAGDFIPFESAGGGPGWVKPANLITTGLTFSNCELISGGYETDDNYCYIDMCLKSTSDYGTKSINGLATFAKASTYLNVRYAASTSDVGDDYTGTSPFTSTQVQTQTSFNSNNNTFAHIWGMCALATT